MLYFNVAPDGEKAQIEQLKVVGHCLQGETVFRNLEVSLTKRAHVVFKINMLNDPDFEYRYLPEMYVQERDKLPVFLADAKRNLYKAKADTAFLRINHDSVSSDLVIVLEKKLTRVVTLPDYVKPIIKYWQPIHVSARIAKERVTRIQKPKRKKFETPDVLKRNRGKNALLRTRISNAALRS